MTQASTPQALKAKLLALMVFRVVLALAFLGITTWFQIKAYSFTQPNLYPLYAIVIAIGLLTILYALILNRIRDFGLFAYVQLTIDIALITVIVYVTGGTDSYLNTLYSLSIIGGSILLSRRGGFFAASVSSIAYGVLIDMDFYGILPQHYKVFIPASTPLWWDVFRTLATNILAFFSVAYLSGYLAVKTASVEKELEEKEVDFEKLELLNRHIVENITSGIMTLDGQLRITSFNREAENVTGYTLREIYSRSVHEIFPGMIQSGGVPNIRMEKKFRKKDGEEVFLGFSISQGQGGDVDRIVIFQDLSQLKAMEEQLRRDEKMKALGELSVGIAHEIRNPLASISGSIQVLKSELNTSGENMRLMDIALRETERLNMLITDFLLFARPAREKRRRVNLSGIIAETIEIFRNCPEAGRIKIENRIEGDLSVQGDARQLGQVFWNLFLNAAHAMPDGGTLAVSSRFNFGESVQGPRTRSDSAIREGAALVEIKVADTGTGIRPEDLNRIFDPFFSTKDIGTGLGLSIVHRIIESHGGSISVGSVVGGGTVFKITLPLETEAIS